MLKISTADYQTNADLGYIQGIRYDYDFDKKTFVYMYDISIRITPYELITCEYFKNTGETKNKTWKINHSDEWAFKLNKKSITTKDNTMDLLKFFSDEFWECCTESMFNRMDNIA